MSVERRKPLPFELTTSGFRINRFEYEVIRDDLDELELPNAVSEELRIALDGAVVASKTDVLLADKSIPLLANYYTACAAYASENHLASVGDDLRCAQELTKLAISLELLPE